MTLVAGNCWVGNAGKNAIGVSPDGTNPAAIAGALPATSAPEKAIPPPTTGCYEYGI